MNSPVIVSTTYDVEAAPWFSPKEVLVRFEQLRSVYGDKILTPDFKKAQEMFSAAATLLGAYELSPENLYWLQLNKQSPSPDVMAAKRTKRPNKPILLELTQMEMTEFEDHSKEDNIIEFLKTGKLSAKKAYGDKTMIVCLVNRIIPINHRDIYTKLQNLQPKSTIYIVGRLQGSEFGKFIIFTPNPLLTRPLEYDLIETSQKYSIHSPMTFHLGMADKTTYAPTTKAISNYEVFGLDEEKLTTKFKIK